MDERIFSVFRYQRIYSWIRGPSGEKPLERTTFSTTKNHHTFLIYNRRSPPSPLISPDQVLFAILTWYMLEKSCGSEKSAATLPWNAVRKQSKGSVLNPSYWRVLGCVELLLTGVPGHRDALKLASNFRRSSLATLLWYRRLPVYQPQRWPV